MRLRNPRAASGRHPLRARALLASITAACCGAAAACNGASPIADAGVGPAADETLAVMTWNTAHGHESSLDRIAAVVRDVDPDLVLLQETHADEAERIASEIDMVARPGTMSKSALFSSAGARLVRSRELAPDRWGRSIDVYRDRGIAIANTHLAVDDGVRRGQMSVVVDTLRESAVTLLAGDLNAGPESETLAALEDAGWTNISGTEPTFPEREERLDYILASRDVAVRSARVIDTGASDHRPVVVRLSLTSPARAAARPEGDAGRETEARVRRAPGGRSWHEL